MIPKKIKKIYLNDIDENGSDMQNREYIDLSQVWHDASEIPKNREWILMQYGEDCYDTYLLRHFDADMFCAWCKKYDVIRWAYIDDLIPKGGNV